MGKENRGVKMEGQVWKVMGRRRRRRKRIN